MCNGSCCRVVPPPLPWSPSLALPLPPPEGGLDLVREVSRWGPLVLVFEGGNRRAEPMAAVVAEIVLRWHMWYSDAHGENMLDVGSYPVRLVSLLVTRRLSLGGLVSASSSWCHTCVCLFPLLGLGGPCCRWRCYGTVPLQHSWRRPWSMVPDEGRWVTCCH